jgi:ABC-type arginine transport system permease subunit
VASPISTYRAEYVPGLLQTEAYATAVHRAALMNADEGEISKQVAVRMARQHRLTEPAMPARNDHNSETPGAGGENRWPGRGPGFLGFAA